MNSTIHAVAPDDLLQQDLTELHHSQVLRTTAEVENLVFLYTAASHAQSGHKVFNGKMYPNTTFSDAARAARFSAVEMQYFQQSLIDAVYELADRIIAGERPDRAMNSRGEPLMGYGPFRLMSVDAIGLMQGLYLGGLRDSAEVRDIADDKWGSKIGSGKTYFVNRAMLQKMGLDGSMLATQQWSDKIDDFKAAGLIVETGDPEGLQSTPMYIRHRTGTGASDDSAIVCAGRLWGMGAAVGMFLSDVIDTLEKGICSNADQDYQLAIKIENEFKELGMGREEAYKLTYLSAVVPEGDPRAVDCTLRRFLLVDRRYDICAIESHFQFVEKRPVPVLSLDKTHVASDLFYQYIEERLAAIKS